MKHTKYYIKYFYYNLPDHYDYDRDMEAVAEDAKRGRPREYETAVTEVITLRFTRAQKDFLQKRAGSESIPVFLRRLVQRWKENENV